MNEHDPSEHSSIKAASDNLESAQWWLLFAIMVANKSADQTKVKLNRLLELLPIKGGLPFEQVEEASKRKFLGDALITVKTGQYRRIEGAFKAVVAMRPNDPREWSLEQIEALYGIGPKTARWFFLLCHPRAKVAALDTHILKFLRDQKIADVPKSTPTAGPTYSRLEQEFIAISEKLGLWPRDFDYTIWTVYRNNGKILFSNI